MEGKIYEPFKYMGSGILGQQSERVLSVVIG